MQATVDNLAIMHVDYWERPLPILSSILNNQLTYADELLSGEGFRIPGQIAVDSDPRCARRHPDLDDRTG
ncbi:hypothetical protein [Mycolicibacterium sp.]|uniref:hypothetical protein n=1 Tax=Mycolicibacterium sp. TaxID=2320850 RepID=UPI0028A7ECFA|nr:hypothetical protein [Mycolicibacterium sp.]